MKGTNQPVGSLKEMKRTENVDGIERKLKDIEKRGRDLEWRAIDNEARSRRNNLLFYGIPEEEEGNCDNVIRSLIDKTEFKPKGLNYPGSSSSWCT